MLNFKSVLAASAVVAATCCVSAFAGVVGVSSESGITKDGTIDWGLLGSADANPTISQPVNIATGIAGVTARVSQPDAISFARDIFVTTAISRLT